MIEQYKKQISSYCAELKLLKDSYGRGKILKSGIKTAIIGRPNAGKSSLLNTLLGYDRAIVTEIPGTTRDTIEEKAIVGGRCLRLIDTAGIRATDDEIEQLGVERSIEAINKADLIISLFDGCAEFNDEDRHILELTKNANAGIAVISKSDLPDYDAALLKEDIPVVHLSAVTGEGIEDLGLLIQKLFPSPEISCGEILTNERQFEAVAEAFDYLEEAMNALNIGETPDIILTEIEGALEAIGELSGKNIREDITNRIFSRFCVGK